MVMFINVWPVAIFLAIIGLIDALVMQIDTKTWNLLFILSTLYVLSKTEFTIASVVFYFIGIAALGAAKFGEKIHRKLVVPITVGYVVIAANLVLALYYQFYRGHVDFLLYGAFAANYIIFNHIQGPNYDNYYGSGDVFIYLVFATLGLFGFAVMAAARAFGMILMRKVTVRGAAFVGYPFLFGIAIPYIIVAFVLTPLY